MQHCISEHNQFVLWRCQLMLVHLPGCSEGRWSRYGGGDAARACRGPAAQRLQGSPHATRGAGGGHRLLTAAWGQCLCNTLSSPASSALRAACLGPAWLPCLLSLLVSSCLPHSSISCLLTRTQRLRRLPALLHPSCASISRAAPLPRPIIGAQPQITACSHL